MATALAPYASHPDLPQFHHQVEECADELRAVGDLAARARREALEPPRPVHGAELRGPGGARQRPRRAGGTGGPHGRHGPPARGGRGAPRRRRRRRLEAGPTASCAGFEGLSDRARERLVIENDDRTYGCAARWPRPWRAGLRRWSVDLLHHHCNDPDRIPDREALELALATWPDGVNPQGPLLLAAGPRGEAQGGRPPGRALAGLPDLREHADLVDPMAFESFLRETAAGLDFDVMLEAKGKDLALLRLRTHLDCVTWQPRPDRSRMPSAGSASATPRRRSATRCSPRSPASRSSRSTPRRTCRDPERIGFPGEFPFTRGVYPSMYRGPAVDDAPVRRLRHGGGDQRALPLPARPRADGAVDGVRHAVADGPRLRPPALARARSGREGVAIDTLDDMETLFGGIPHGRGLDLDDDQRAGGGDAGLLRGRGRAPGRRRRSGWRARSRPTSSRSTSPRRSGASRSTRRCGWSRT